MPVQSLTLRQYADMMLLLYGICWAVVNSFTPDRILQMMGTDYAEAVQQV